MNLDLPALWFGVAVLAWVLFWVLEGFDFGVGVLARVLGRDEDERGQAVATVGPVWDGNEVWLVAAIGVMFAAFPDWYAAALSGLYLPMVALLLLLAVRGVAIEFRGKHFAPRWRARCDLALAVSSALLALLWGAVLGVLATGLALGVDGEVAGTGPSRSLAPLLSPGAGLGALLGLGLCLLQGATFLGLRTTGPLRRRARRVALAVAVLLTAALGGVGALHGPPVLLVAAAAPALVAVLVLGRREALAFTASSLTVAAGVVATFTAHLGAGVLLPSTLPGGADVTLRGAASSPAALELITVVGVVVLPAVLVYQIWSYRVFRHRVSGRGPAMPPRTPVRPGAPLSR
ncbi:cytochrome d ubiquinol oxidase subunit II [Kineococcus gynurae]|uniref:Cytochrome d ubiquinol oxidase subunit II n=1 Tax=Kineococcus gynurae TaxID=452979 RepID=A0ABV5LR70_9ACTN